MALTQRLELRQGQSLVMTPQLQQAIKLLQMSNLELQAFVEAELERNPLLERDERDEAGDGQAGAEVEGRADGAGGDDVSTVLADESRSAETLAALDAELDNVYDGELRPSPGGLAHSGWSSLRSGGPAAEDFDLEAVLRREATLIEHLTDQLNLAIADPAERLIGLHLIGLVNDAGYLAGDLHSVAETLSAPLAQVEKVLAVLQTFDPTGVFARDLPECLALQLKERDRFDPAIAALVANLDLVARRDFQRLKQICRCDLDDIKDMIAEIRRLNPKPGNAFGNVVVQPVIPDVFVRLGRDGAWVVELNTDTLPRVLVNSQYYAVVARGAKRDDDRLYLSECHANATWLVKSLDQRARTILTVSREIVRQQDAFLVRGIEALRPLNLRTVAEAIGMHESTVSRVTANKYLATPRGTFEMKYFFTTAIPAAEGGEAHSAEAVRHRIKELIGAEAAGEVLSDDAIVDRLRAGGIDIARRTVAKYRESLGIPSSVERRRERRAGL